MATVDPLAEPGVCTHRPPSPGQSLCQCGHLQIEAQYAVAIAAQSSAAPPLNYKPAPDFDVHAVQHGEAVPVPEGWAMIIAGPAQPGGPDVVLAAWDTDDTFHQYATTEAIARALVAYLQDVIHV